MFLTDAEVKTALAATLKIAESSLPAYYDTIIPQAHQRAYGDIRSRLLRRGFTLDEINDWDAGEEFERDLSLFWALTRAGAYQGYDEKTLASMDRRKELNGVLVFIDGEWVKPQGDKPGLIATAGPADTSGIFNWPDPDDPNLGEVTRF